MYYIIVAAVLGAFGVLSLLYVDPLGMTAFVCMLLAAITLIVGALRYLWKNRGVFTK